MPRIKVSPTGTVVVYEPHSEDPGGPWYCMYYGAQMFYTDDEVRDWPEWGPVEAAEFEEFTTHAVNVKKDDQIYFEGEWRTVRLAIYSVDRMFRSLHVEGWGYPAEYSPYMPVTVRRKQ